MLLATRKKPLKKISEITFDLEIINPIESKNLFGGCDYKWDCGCNDNLWWHNPNPSSLFDGPGGFIGFSSSGNSGDSGGGYSGNDWQQYDHNDNSNPYDTNNDGIDDADQNYIPVELKNLPTTVPQQIGNTCVATNASFVASLFGTIQSPDFMIVEYITANNFTAAQQLLIYQNGVGQDTQVAFFLLQFNMTGINTIAEMTNAIDNQHPVLAATIDAQGNGHEVTIVGYDNATTKFKAYDSVTGTYAQYLFTDISLAILSWEVTGVKP